MQVKITYIRFEQLFPVSNLCYYYSTTNVGGVISIGHISCSSVYKYSTCIWIGIS